LRPLGDVRDEAFAPAADLVAEGRANEGSFWDYRASKTLGGELTQWKMRTL
jgi:hypothetical protein